MTCHERVDLMQRYLDRDLSGEEEQELMLHLQQCGECAGLFDKLKRLDQELAQLPKVVPATSLVDAILPQLAELDRFPAALEETAAQEPTVVAATGSIPRTRRPFFSWRLAGGTAVAAALIGLFVMKEQNLLPLPPSHSASNSAAMAGGAMADRAKSSSAASGGAPASQEIASAGDAASKSDAPPADAKKAAPAGAVNPAAPAAAAKAPNTAAAGSASAAKPGQVQHDAAASDSNVVSISSPAATAPEAANEPGALARNNVMLAPAPSPQPEQQTNASTPAANSTAAAGSKPAGTEPPAGGGGAGQLGIAAPQGKVAAPSSDSAPAQYPYASLAAPPPALAPVTMQSPDGKWVAAVDNLKVVVRRADTGVTVRTSTYSWQTMDVITLTGFTADGKLSYRVQHPAGADDVVLDVATGAETKIVVPPAAK